MGYKYSIYFIIEKLFFELDKLADNYDELTDTDVRESLHMTLNYFFVWGMKNSQYPISYGMFSPEGDSAVARTVQNFIKCADACPDVSNLPIGQTRLDLLQNLEIITPSGRHYDEFIGHADKPLPREPLPDFLFRKGDYDS